MNDGSRALGGRYCEKLGEPYHVRDQAPALISKARGDEARMQAIRGDAVAMQAACELAREQDVAELRAAVGLHGAKALLRLQVAEVECCATMGVGSGVDDARVARAGEPRAQALRHDEIGHVVEREGALEAVLRDPARAEH